MRIFLFTCLVFLGLPALAGGAMPGIMTSADLPSLGNPPAQARIAYGDGPLQFADLRLPDGDGPHPVMILIHGGCWLAEYDLTYIGKLAAALGRAGIATWTVEYRRVGDPGGGWPGTFQDVAQASDHLLAIAETYALDTSRVIAAGHSAGGHLALWLAAREQFADNPLFASTQRLKLQGVLGLAPAADLSMLHRNGVCDNVVDGLMGGSPEEFPERYAIGSATALIPIGIPQVLVVGRHDKDWIGVGRHHYALARAAKDKVELLEAPESGHFEMIDPDSSTWPLVRDAAYRLLGMTGGK